MSSPFMDLMQDPMQEQTSSPWGQPSPQAPVSPLAHVATDILHGPGPKRPSLFDRIAQRLYHINPAYANLLSPEQKASLSRQGLQKLGLGLLQAGGPRPTGSTNALSRIGEALGSVDFNTLQDQSVTRSMQVQKLVQEQEAADARNAIFAQYPTPEGETKGHAITRLNQIQSHLLEVGDTASANTVNAILSRLQPSGMALQHVPGLAKGIPGVPDGTPGVWLINPQTGERVDFVVGKGTQTFHDLTPADQARLWGDLHDNFANEMKPVQDIATAYRTYQGVKGTSKSPAAQREVLAAANNVINPSHPMSAADLVDPNLLEGVLAALHLHLKMGEGLNLEGLDTQVQGAVRAWRERASAIVQRHRSAASGWGVEEDRQSYIFNPFSGEAPDPAKAVLPNGTPQSVIDQMNREAAGVKP